MSVDPKGFTVSGPGWNPLHLVSVPVWDRGSTGTTRHSRLLTGRLASGPCETRCTTPVAAGDVIRGDGS